MKLSRFSSLLFAGATICLVANADSIGTVYVSLGPDANGAPTNLFATYNSNAQTGMMSGNYNVGGSINTTPTAFNASAGSLNVTTKDIIVDGQAGATPNWRGVYNPGGAFNTQIGAFAYFSIVIMGNGTNNLHLSDISYVVSDTDTVCPNCFGNTGNYSGATYNLSGDQGYYANGTAATPGTPGTTGVNEIVLTAFGEGWDAGATCGSGPCYPGSGQTQLTEAINDLNTIAPFTMSVCFSDTADSLSSCGSLNVSATPEPTTFALFGLGFALAVPLVRRARRRNA